MTEDILFDADSLSIEQLESDIKRLQEQFDALHVALKRVEHELDQWVYAGQGVARVARAEEIIKAALAEVSTPASEPEAS